MRQKRKVLRLRQERRAREWSQTTLGKKVGLEKSTISEIESGRMKPSHDTMFALAKVFGVRIEELFSQVEIPA